MTEFGTAQLRRQRNWAYGIAAVCSIALIVEVWVHRQGEATVSQGPPRLEIEHTQDKRNTPYPVTSTPVRSAPPEPAQPASAAPVTAPSLVDTVDGPPDRRQSALDKFFSAERWETHPLFLHNEHRREQRDRTWAGAAETAIEDFIARHPYAHAYEELLVECRASLCQVYAELEPSMAVAIEQSAVGNTDPFARLTSESLGSDLEAVSSSFGSTESDRMMVVITLRRRP